MRIQEAGTEAANFIVQAFNSLFEMPGQTAAVEDVLKEAELSILYLRCPGVGQHRLEEVALDLSILYLRCQ